MSLHEFSEAAKVAYWFVGTVGWTLVGAVCVKALRMR
jgi:hypothetical protein